jgi:GT2 family glycosyltransferase
VSQLAYSVIIATYERPAELRTTLESLAAQTRLPALVVVVDSSPDNRTCEVVDEFQERLPLLYERASRPSAARQRNTGANRATSPLVAFIDDDVFVPPETLGKLCEVFERDAEGEVGGVAARIDGMQHPTPRGLLWWYYRLQAGYSHPTYGGKLFGPGINCLPSYTEGDGDLIPSDWLNSTCVFYRTELFQRELFPQFEGYSFLEDVHVSSRIGRTHRLYFHRTATFEHRDAPSTFKKNIRELIRMRLRHQRVVARDILRIPEPVLTLKLLLHRAFASVWALREHSPQWREILIGTWT